ncbi:hypothetical protein CRENBAI_005774 [Crenichthys baileyi]|uniref:Secreted protein n=1 Tax=Crenichthys baileyi TaxID=28760 RepID=A0AAV9S169_9TELE
MMSLNLSSLTISASINLVLTFVESSMALERKSLKKDDSSKGRKSSLETEPTQPSESARHRALRCKISEPSGSAPADFKRRSSSSGPSRPAFCRSICAGPNQGSHSHRAVSKTFAV